MSTSTAVDITELALSVHLADTMSTIDEKDLPLLVNDDARRRVSRGSKLG
jgi:hypothetical protein